MNTTAPTEAEWLLERKKGIGGSDASAVVGLNPWRTPYQVYAEKTNPSILSFENPAMYWGKALEPVIRQEYSERTGRPVLLPNGIIRHPQHPWMQASLDGFTEDERIFEAKTARSADGWGEPGTDEIPQYYLIQVQHYLAVTAFQVADVAVLIGGSDFRMYEIQADPELHEMLINAEGRFWAQVQAKSPPEPTTETDLKLLYRLSKAESIEATQEISYVTTALKDLKAEIKQLETQEEELALQIKLYLGERDTLLTGGKTSVTWKSTKPGQKFHLESFKVDHPDLYEEYLLETEPQRRFLVK